MNPIEGRVLSLTMRAPDEATWQRVAELVEEAIRSAAIDAELPGRVFVVRQLDIGNIARAASPQSLALAIESAVDRVTSQAVSADDPAAAGAPMIYFKDDASVVLSLAQRVASNKPATEWFWPSVVKGWTSNTPADRAMPLLVERAMSTSSGVVTLAQVVDTLASTGVLDKVLERLSPSDGRALLETIGWTEAMVRAAGAGASEGASEGAGEPVADVLVPQFPARTPMPEPSAHIGEQAHIPPQIPAQLPAQLPAQIPAQIPARTPPLTAAQTPRQTTPQMPMTGRAQSLVQRWVDRWDGNPRDPRAVWLGAMLLVADRAARSTSAEWPEMVRLWLAAVATQSQANEDDEGRNNVASQAMRRDDLIADARAWLQSHPRSPLDSLFGGGPPRSIPPDDSRLDPRAVGRRHPGDEAHVGASPDESPSWKNPRPSNHAGLLFVVPLLTRTGMANIVANDPGLIERDWPAALLLRLARRLGVPREDPAVAWITASAVAVAHADRSLTAEVFRAARIRLRMEIGLTMRQLVHRSGAIVAARTTIDVFLHHADIDTKLLGAGLHSDPDLVPWLGRAVQFHYLDTIDVNA